MIGTVPEVDSSSDHETDPHTDPEPGAGAPDLFDRLVIRLDEVFDDTPGAGDEQETSGEEVGDERTEHARHAQPR